MRDFCGQFPWRKFLIIICTGVFLHSSHVLAGEKSTANETDFPGTTGTGRVKDLPIQAFVSSISLEKLQDLVVTESKIPQSRETVTQKLEIFSAERISRVPANTGNIAETIQYSSGQFVNPLSRNDANWGSFGGLGPKYNGYLLDGLGIDSFVDGMSLDPWAFECIELHKGPASVMYSNYLTMDFAGNETPLAGITNFILKDRIERPLTRLSIGGGTYKTFQNRLYHQNRRGKLHYFFGMNKETSDYTNYGTTGSWLNMLDNPGYRRTRGYAKLSYQFGEEDHKLSVFLHQTRHEGDFGRPNRDFDNAYDTVNIDYSNQMSGTLNLQFKTGYRDNDREWGEDKFNPGTVPVDLSLREKDGVEQSIHPSDLTFNLKHHEHGLLTFGADSQTAKYKTYAQTAGTKTFGSSVHADSTGFFLQEKYIVGKWVFRAGGRRNKEDHSYDLLSGIVPETTSKSWNKTLWSIGTRCNYRPKVAFYGNMGTSFVTPTAKQLGGTIQTKDAGVAGKNGQLPNFQLNPETGIGMDLGVDFRFSDNLSLNIRGFSNQVEDAIVENIVSTTPSQTRSENAGKAISRGLEIDVENQVSERFQWFSNLTYTKCAVESSLDPDQDGVEISFVPRYAGNIGATMKSHGNLMVSPYVQFIGEYYDSISRKGRTRFPSYQVLNIRIQRKFIETSDRSVNGIIDLNNVTDKKYEMPWQFGNPGFNFSGSLEMNF